MLALNNVEIHLSGARVIHDVSFSVSPGELVCLLGNNGAGKSTLVRGVTGELPLSDGEVYINGENIANIHPKTLAKIRAVMPQNVDLNFSMEAGCVVRLGRQPYGLFSTRDEEFSQHSMRLCHCDHLQDRDYLHLSGGEKQRVQLARVFNQSLNELSLPGYLIVDECTSSLDLTHQHHIYQQLKRKAKKEGLGVLAIVHDVNLATVYADRIGFLHRGELLTIGPVDRVISPEVMNQVYGLHCLVTTHPSNGRPIVLAS